MCTECGLYTCSPRCPNADEPERIEVAICDECDEHTIYDDEDYLYFPKTDIYICKDCQDKSMVYA